MKTIFKSAKVQEMLENELGLPDAIGSLNTMYHAWVGSKCSGKMRASERREISKDYGAIQRLLMLLDLESRTPQSEKKIIDVIFPDLISEYSESKN